MNEATNKPTLYEVLGVPASASESEITAAYRRLVRVTHPDAGGNDYLFGRVHNAHKVLSDPSRRAAYDRECSRDTTSNTDRDVIVDDGWTRIDDPPQNSPSNRASKHVSFRDRVFGWDWQHRRYNPSTTRGRRRIRDVISGFFATRPWLIVLFLSLVLAHRLPQVATLLFVLAVVAGIGSRRASRRRTARRVKPGQFDRRLPGPLIALSLLGAELMSGVVVFFSLFAALFRHRSLRRRYRTHPSDWW